MKLYPQSEFSDLSLGWKEKRALSFVESHSRWRNVNLIAAVGWCILHFLVLSSEAQERVDVLLILLAVNAFLGQVCFSLMKVLREHLPVHSMFGSLPAEASQ